MSLILYREPQKWLPPVKKEKPVKQKKKQVAAEVDERQTPQRDPLPVDPLAAKFTDLDRLKYATRVKVIVSSLDDVCKHYLLI